MKYVIALGVGALAVPAIAWLHDPGAGFTRLYVLLAVLSAILAFAALILPRADAPRAAA